MNTVKAEDVQSLIELFDGSDWNELYLQFADFKIHLSKDGAMRREFGAGTAQPAPPDAKPAGIVPNVSAPPVAMVASAPADIPEGMSVVRAPNLGTFYKSPKPGTPPYVEIGQHVEADTEICLIEVMKLFTPVKAGVAGIIRQALVNDAELVEFEQPLFVIEVLSK
jgi:acetyl-CoA carboxylase biotin carboxyl carrier protein